ncbi:major capsid protein [Parvibaculum sp.]|uniref:major capsid protein n=1 Tax=Parvibaculum sp. TaxID=2024848 RepID=UPI001D1D5F5C|nr:major capsid protein [Parvibaculum sp.]MBX3488873.1 major capsid protein [Parvibaculum sp.]
MTDVFTTRQLVKLVEDLRRPRSFLLDRFFPEIQTFDTEVIDFDVLTGGRKLAPFVSPYVAGKPRKERGFVTKTFKPAYVKPKTPIKITGAFRRRPGERYAGELTPDMRHDLAVMEALEDHAEEVLRRKEWMAAGALDAGKYDVEGEDYPKVEVDFGRHTDLTVALTSGDRWGETGVKVMDTIESWAETVQGHSGAVVTDVVMDPKAWKLARKDEDFQKLLDNRRQASGNVELGPISLSREGARYVGNVGDFDFFVYQEIYEDEAGAPQKLLADHTVLMGGSDIEGVQAHGAIQDPQAGLAAMELFPKNWVENDPPLEFAMTQSAPLVIPSRPNASFRARVR